MTDVLLVLGSIVFACAALLNVVYGLSHFTASFILRPLPTAVAAFSLSALCSLFFWWMAGSDSPLAYIALCFSLLTYPVSWLVSLWAWLTSRDEDRKSAHAIRAELADRYGERGPESPGWYPQALYDIERVARRRTYEAPATD